MFDNSLDAVSDRDFVAEALFALALLGVHLSRIGEEIVLWSTEEFGFLKLDDAYATGSSMLPQKKNPDIAELARGKAGRLIGHLTGLPRHAEGPAARVQPRPAGGQGAAVRRGRPGEPRPRRHGRAAAHRRRSTPTAWQAAADSPYAAATDLAELLVERGMPFRDAHAIVGALVRDSIEPASAAGRPRRGRTPRSGRDAAALLEPGCRGHPPHDPGGAGPSRVADAARPLPRPAVDADRTGGSADG